MTVTRIIAIIAAVAAVLALGIVVGQTATKNGTPSANVIEPATAVTCVDQVKAYADIDVATADLQVAMDAEDNVDLPGASVAYSKAATDILVLASDYDAYPAIQSALTKASNEDLLVAQALTSGDLRAATAHSDAATGYMQQATVTVPTWC